MAAASLGRESCTSSFHAQHNPFIRRAIHAISDEQSQLFADEQRPSFSQRATFCAPLTKDARMLGCLPSTIGKTSIGEERVSGCSPRFACEKIQNHHSPIQTAPRRATFCAPPRFTFLGPDLSLVTKVQLGHAPSAKLRFATTSPIKAST